MLNTSSIVAQVVILFSLLFSSFSVVANEPTEETLKGALSFEIPRQWSVKTMTISASQNFGTEESPYYKQRFEAELVPKEPMYKLSRWEGSVEVISLESGPENPVVVYGMAASEIKGGRLNTIFELENKPYNEVKSIRNFSSTAVILGSTEELAMMDKKVAAAEAAAREKAEAEAKRRAKAEKVARLAQEKKSRFRSLVSKYQAIEGVKKLSSYSNGRSEDQRFPMTPGDTYYLIINGSERLSGCWGIDIYKPNSSIVGAAIHSGVMSIGETSVVKVSVVRNSYPFKGSTRNGARCTGFGNPTPIALKFTKIHDENYYEL